MRLSSRFPAILAAVSVVYFAVLAINPVSRAVWIAEVIPVVLVFALVLYATIRPDRDPRLIGDDSTASPQTRR